MKYPPSVLDEIRARLPVSAVVGKRVRLTKAGREWKGLSPFNKERSPSFFVNDQKMAWFDFSSGKNGNIFDFVMETEGLTFPEAVQRLAAEAGVTLPRFTREDEAETQKRAGLHDVMEMAAVWFEKQLAVAAGAKARAYLTGRGLDGAIQRRFRIGFAPGERYGLRDHLAGQGVSSEQMIEAGLLVTGEDIAVPYDRFRDRIMFPIHDPRGKVVAFGGRAMSAEVAAKYLNSPETTLFHKGRLLYNHHLARKAAHDAGTVIAVEGYVDVIAMTQAGFPHCVAPLGTALTQDQVTLMWRMADEPILCFDGDKAGQRAAFRAIDVILPELVVGKSVRFALLPEGQDPDDLARSGGPAAIERVIAGARPLVDMLWERESEASPLDTPERRAAFEQRILRLVGEIRDEALRRHYRAEIESRLSAVLPAPSGGRGQGHARRAERGSGEGRWSGRGDSRGGAGGGFARSGRGMTAGPLRPSSALARHPMLTGAAPGSPREAMILATLLTHPELLGRYAEQVAELAFDMPEAQRLRSALLDAVGEGAALAPEIIEQRLVRAGLSAAADRVRGAVRRGDHWALDPHAPATRVEDALQQAMALHRRARTLHSELKLAQQALADGGDEADLAHLRDVQAQIAAIESAEAGRDGGAI
jgi:DNA primase